MLESAALRKIYTILNDDSILALLSLSTHPGYAEGDSTPTLPVISMSYSEKERTHNAH